MTEAKEAVARIRTLMAGTTPVPWGAHEVRGHKDWSQIDATLPDGSKTCVAVEIGDNDSRLVVEVMNSLPLLLEAASRTLTSPDIE